MALGVDALQFDILTSDPVSPPEGYVWWNSTEQALKVQRSGDAVPITSNLDHPALRQLTHFIDDGPAEGFASGAYRETVGGLFPTSVTWYDQAGVGKKKIVEKLYTWTGATPTTVVWKVYDASEVLLATVTDIISYSGLIETSRTRTLT